MSHKKSHPEIIGKSSTPEKVQERLRNSKIEDVNALKNLELESSQIDHLNEREAEELLTLKKEQILEMLENVDASKDLSEDLFEGIDINDPNVRKFINDEFGIDFDRNNHLV